MARKFRSAAEQLSHLGGWLDNWNSMWNDRWSLDQLVKLHAFHMSPQSDYIDEQITLWPRWLLDAVLKLKPGQQLDEKMFERAKAWRL